MSELHFSFSSLMCDLQNCSCVQSVVRTTRPTFSRRDSGHPGRRLQTKKLKCFNVTQCFVQDDVNASLARVSELRGSATWAYILASECVSRELQGSASFRASLPHYPHAPSLEALYQTCIASSPQNIHVSSIMSLEALRISCTSSPHESVMHKPSSAQ